MSCPQILVHTDRVLEIRTFASFVLLRFKTQATQCQCVCSLKNSMHIAEEEERTTPSSNGQFPSKRRSKNSLRWTLSFPNLYVVPHALGEFNGVVRSPIFQVPDRIDFARMGNLETHNPTEKTPSVKQLILFYHVSSTCYWACPSASMRLKQTFVAVFASRFRLVILTYGKMPIDHTTDPHTFL